MWKIFFCNFAFLFDMTISHEIAAMNTSQESENPYIRDAETSNKLLRLDKNVANSIDQIIDLSQSLGTSGDLYMTTEDKNMINNIIFFLCHSKQNNLYGFGGIIPKEFADFIGVTEGYLRKRHNNPVQLRGKTADEIKQMYKIQEQDPTFRIYDSILENALYTLNTVPLNFRTSAKEAIKEGSETKYILMSKTYILLEELNTIIIRGNRGGEPRVSYKYTLHEKFQRNLSLYFMRFDVKSVISLRRAGLDELYIYLKNLKDIFLEKKKAGDTYDRKLNFNQMCSLADVPRYAKDGSEFKNPRNIKYKLNAAFQKVNKETDLRFTIQWGKYHDTSPGNYVPKIYFDEVEQYQKTKGHEIYMDLIKFHERRMIFRQNLILELIKCYGNHNEDHDNTEERLLEWIVSDKDMQSKDLAFRNAQYESFGRVHPNIDKIVDDWKLRIKHLKDMNNIVDNLDVNMRD